MNRPAINRLVATMLLVAMSLTLADCGRIRDSRLNPFNWFGHSRAAATAAATLPGEASDGRQLIQQVTSLDVEQVTGGAIIRAAGLPPTQGWWKADLVADNRGRPVDGVLTYRFLVFQPAGQAAVSTPQSRELTAAVFMSDNKLAEVTKIVVQGETNNRSTGR